MTRTAPRSDRAKDALALVERFQTRFVRGLDAIGARHGASTSFQPIEWLRDEGRHGGGVRFAQQESAVWNGGSVNASCVHYDDEPARKLGAASALSTIIHPRNPRAPSVHMHYSYTEMKDGTGYWRMMADLNPAIPDDGDTARFRDAMKAAAGPLAEAGFAQGDRYFAIPALGRTRGVTHFYLEEHDSGDFARDLALAERCGNAGIDTYLALVEPALDRPFTDADRAAQLAYHTLYLFQVLTLDRGTTSGLLVHDQNDVGIMGSLPAYVDRALLASWAAKVPAPQDALVRALCDALPEPSPSHVTAEVRQSLARAVRAHYRAHPEALELQASGNVVPPTVDNHASRS